MNMNRKERKRWSPRHDNAVKQTAAYARRYFDWWCMFTVVSFYMMMYHLKYEADRYDVLNALCPGAQNNIVTFARGDIRHRKRKPDTVSLMLMVLAVLLMLISLRLIQDC